MGSKVSTGSPGACLALKADAQLCEPCARVDMGTRLVLIGTVNGPLEHLDAPPAEWEQVLQLRPALDTQQMSTPMRQCKTPECRPAALVHSGILRLRPRPLGRRIAWPTPKRSARGNSAFPACQRT